MLKMQWQRALVALNGAGWFAIQLAEYSRRPAHYDFSLWVYLNGPDFWQITSIILLPVWVMLAVCWIRNPR